MKKQIIISPDSKLSIQERGDFFEKIMRDVFEGQRYNIKQRTNFTGMEIDLIAQHRDRENEEAYIECKARERIDSTDIKNFSFNVIFKEVDYGYFLSTVDFEHQAGGLIHEMKNKPKYKNLYFWGPDKIIELLESAAVIKPPDSQKLDFSISKELVLFTSYGNYYLFILKKDLLPSHFVVFDAVTKEEVTDTQILAKIKMQIIEIANLQLYKSNVTVKNTKANIAEAVAEVQESENWFDYLPASTKYFIGRDDLKSDIFTFLKQVLHKETSRRVFYIEGKSGWGKSSLIAEIRGRTRNKYYHNKYFAIAIDARSASSSNFVALSFSKLIEEGISHKFIDQKYKVDNDSITSNFDILDSEYIKKLIRYLDEAKKVLILIFDQFEDVFRKPGLFQAFHKFLVDVNEIQSNIVIGFSWKSEINVPIDHEAYHLWQRAKEFVLSIPMREFNSSEIKGVVKQLEVSIGKSLDLDLKRRLVESSQGFPWLIKKLCIHTYKQLQAGKTIESLIEQDLNCEVLFKKDLEDLSPSESKALKYIAKRSYDLDFFDITEVDEKLTEEVIAALTHKRLIIKSGTKYNVYWDIFRDYLVTNEVPPIGESYILRQKVNLCEEMYRIFESNKRKMTLLELSKLHPRKPREVSLDNILRDLRGIGLIQKSGEYFYLSHPEFIRSGKTFKMYLQTKFSKYTPYLKLKNIKSKDINIQELIKLLQNIFIATSFSERTWEIYAKVLVSWFKFAELDISDKLNIKILKRSTKSSSSFMPQRLPEIDIIFLQNIQKYITPSPQKTYNALYDLISFGYVKYVKNNVSLTDKGGLLSNSTDANIIKSNLARDALRFTRLKRAAMFLKTHPNADIDDFRIANIDLLANIKNKSYKNKSARNLYKWGLFINSNLK